MNRHDDSERRVRSWLHEEGRGELPDWVLDKTFETTRSTPQRRGLRGWLTSTRNDRGSTTRRRANLLTFASISAVAVAGLLAVNAMVDTTTTEPLPPGAEAPVITVEDEMFTGSFQFGPECLDGDGQAIDYCWQQAFVVFDDPRFQGIVEMRANPDYTEDGIYRNQFTIITDEGSWVGDSVPGIMLDAARGAPSVHLFTGTGAYDGLHAVATVDLSGQTFSLLGYVVDGGFPELP